MPGRTSTFSANTGTTDGAPGRLEDVPEGNAFRFIHNTGPMGMGPEISSTHLLLTNAQAEAKLHAGATAHTSTERNSLVKRVDQNYLPSTGRGEDRVVVNTVTKQDINRLGRAKSHLVWEEWSRIKASAKTNREGGYSASGRSGGAAQDGAFVFASVFDGHGGSPALVDVAERTFHQCLAWAMGQQMKGGASIVTLSAEERLAATLGGAFNAPTTAASEAITRALIASHEAWNHDVLIAPLALLAGRIKAPENPILPGFPNPSLLPLAETSVRGTTAVTAVIDAETRMLYIANLGDSRAIAGWWDPITEKWRCDVLTNEHQGGNPAEVARLRSSHPNVERDTIVHDRGDEPRLLGSFQTTRALGDGNINQEDHESKRIAECLGAKGRKPFHPVQTPPYSISTPEVTVRSLKPDNAEQIRFLILASDGLFDRMTSEEAALLTAAHLEHPHHAPIAKADLPRLFPHRPPSLPRPFPAEPMPGSRDRCEGEWVFMDDNAATHLIRNQLGSRGWQAETRRRVLSMEGGTTSSMRDDTSVVVMFFV